MAISRCPRRTAFAVLRSHIVFDGIGGHPHSHSFFPEAVNALQLEGQYCATALPVRYSPNNFARVLQTVFNIESVWDPEPIMQLNLMGHRKIAHLKDDDCHTPSRRSF